MKVRRFGPLTVASQKIVGTFPGTTRFVWGYQGNEGDYRRSFAVTMAGAVIMVRLWRISDYRYHRNVHRYRLRHYGG